MKTKILKAILYLVGWILSVINIGPSGLRFMNQPSNLSLTLGVLLTLSLITCSFVCAYKFGAIIAQLIIENKNKNK